MVFLTHIWRYKELHTFPKSYCPNGNATALVDFKLANYDVTVQCCILAFDQAQNAIQGDAAEGSDTFRWQLGEEIAWAEIG